MLRFYSAGNDVVDSRQALAAAIETAVGEGASECTLLVIYATMGHSFADLLAEARRCCPLARIVGTTCAGVIDRSGPNESMRALAIMAVCGPAEEIAVAGCEMPHGDPFDSARRVAREVHRQNPSVKQLLLHPSVLDFQPIERAIAGVESVMPDIPVFGGLSIDNMRFAGTYQFLDQQVIERGAVAVGLADPTLEIVCGATNGFVAVGEPFEVTRSDGNVVHELNGAPAWDAVTGRLGLPRTATMAEVGAVAVLATADYETPPPGYDSRYIVRGGALCTPEGDVVLNAACDRSTRLYLLKRDERRIFEGVEQLVRDIHQRCSGRQTVAVFHADCAARGKAMFDRIAKDELVGTMLRSFGKPRSVPWLGMYGGGELIRLAGRNRILAYTTSLYAIVRDGSGEA